MHVGTKMNDFTGYCETSIKKQRLFFLQIAEYQETEKIARREHRNIWEYGDFTGNEL